MLSDDVRAAIVARLEAITPGTWEVERWQLWEEWGQPSPDPDHVWLVDGPSWAMNGPGESLDSGADAEFIANAPTDIKRLLDHVDALEAERETQQQRIAALESALLTIAEGNPDAWGGAIAIARRALDGDQ